jgi:[acyl-carrier-protein] S-malonyltransferase
VLIKLAIDHFKDFYMSTKRLEQAAQATKTAFVFPGQGSQKVGMLAELQSSLVCSRTFAEASEALVLICGRLPKVVRV